MAFLSRLSSGRNLLRITNISGTKSTQFHVKIRSITKNNEALKTGVQLTQRRNISIFPLFRKETVEKLKIKDNVPDEYQLIYRNRMEKYLFIAQIFSTVFAGFVVIFLAVSNNVNGPVLNTSGFVQEVGTVNDEMYLYVTCFITVCVLMQLFVKRMPLRIYNLPKQNDYIIVTYATTPGTKKNVFCKIKQVTRVREAGFLPWKEHLYEVPEQGKMVLVENYFRRPADLYIMLGEQKSDYDYE